MGAMFHSLYHQTVGAGSASAASSEPGCEPSAIAILDAPERASDRQEAQAFLNWPASYLDGFQNFDPSHYQLEVCGLVERPHVFTLKELINFTRIQQNRRLVFADGWAYRGVWEGFVVQELLHRVAPRPQARFLIQTNLAGQVECLPIKDLYSQRALFCLAGSGKPLPAIYGGPIRLMVFDRYAHKGLGQLVRLELSDHEIPGSFAEKGYSPTGSIEPGDYYASDLQTIQRIKMPGEVTQW